MPSAVESLTWGPDLDRFEALMRALHRRVGLGTRSIGVPQWDGALWHIGREWLAAHADAVRDSGPDDDTRQADVYLATEIYPIGGHTALIGDFVRALGHRSSHLILTDLNTVPAPPVSDATRLRLGLTAEQVTVLPGPSHLDRLRQLFAALLELRPRRLFLFQHPHDPLVSVVAQPEIARQRLLVHHADAIPSFGMHLPGVRIVDLNPTAAALTRVLGRVPALLPLTAPDPGLRPRRFLADGHLVTATSGSANKFHGRYALSYEETVAVILRSTGGRHVHIGPLYDATRSAILDALARRQISPDRFVHVPSTASIAETLWHHECDLYVASFPADGARARVEVLASGTPYLRHSTRSDPDDDTLDTGRELTWRTWDELNATLVRMANPDPLAAQGARMRRLYESDHHPSVFAATLERILLGGSGIDGADRPDRLEWAVQSMVRSVTASLVNDADAAVSARATRDLLARTIEEAASDRLRLDEAYRLLSQTEERLAAQVNRLQAEQDRGRWSRGARARLRQWLLRS